jgi:hypothetical protein
MHLWSRPVDDTESSKGLNTRWNRIVTVYGLTGCVTEAAEFFGLKLGKLYFYRKALGLAKRQELVRLLGMDGLTDSHEGDASGVSG